MKGVTLPVVLVGLRLGLLIHRINERVSIIALDPSKSIMKN
jgi:hypothetical protein